MPHFCVWLRDDDEQAYWVWADTATEARRLVALNVEPARDAENPEAFECQPDETQAPPFGLIYRRLYGPVSIEKR